MGFVPYQTTVLVPARNSLTFEALIELFRKKVAKGAPYHPAMSTESGKILLKRGEWTLRVYWQDQPYVREEAIEIAKRFASGRPDVELIATCDRMISTGGDPDPNMEYFNDYVQVLEVFETLDDVFKFDGGKFISQYGSE